MRLQTSAVFGAPVVLTATVAGNAGGTATGVVTFKDGATTLGTGTLAAVVWRRSRRRHWLLAAHSLSASYGGDANFVAAATTSPAAVTITQAASTTVLGVNPATAAFGAPIVLTATVSNATTTVSTGTVTFKDGAYDAGNRAR